MWSNLSLENKEWILAVFLTGLVLWGLFIWKEWNGKAGKRFYINTAVAFVAVLFLSLLVLKPSYLRKVKGETVLLTEGFQRETLDSLQRVNRGVSVLEYTPGMDLTATLDSIDHLYLLGHGVRSFDFWQFKEDRVSFLPSEIPKGIVRLKYNQKLKTGSDLIVEGVYRNNTSQDKLVLQGPGEVPLDSFVPDLNVSGFSLKTNLKVSGKFLYYLQIKDSLDKVINREPLPVEVSAGRPLKILMVNEFPSFETKYLKNYLSEEGHQVIAKTKLTKQKYKFEYFNTERVAIYALNEENLKQFDLIVFDTISLQNLTKSERSFLQTAVYQYGLGVFVQQTGTLFQGNTILGQFESVSDNQNSIRLNIGTYPTLEKYPVRFQSEGIMALPIGDYGYSRQFGQGRIGTTHLKDTYQLLLGGKESDYKELWSSLVNGIRKRSKNSTIFRGDTPWAFVNEPYNFSFFTAEEKPNIRLENQYRVPLIKNSVVRDEWQGTVYPKITGWHQLSSALDSVTSFNFYTMQTGSWSPLMNNNILKLNKRYFSGRGSNMADKFLTQIIDPIWFFIGFLLGMGYLWLEPKLR